MVLLSSNSDGKSVLEFYERQNKNFDFTTEIEFEEQINSFTFADLDSSGTIDLILIVKEADTRTIKVIYNSKSEIDEICRSSPEFPFDAKNMKNIEITYPLSSEGILHFGDINSDSYPDLLAIVEVKEVRKPYLFYNEEKKSERTFTAINSKTSSIIT